MSKIYIETENGRVPIDEKIAKKYHLKEGSKTPFTGNSLVDRDGNYPVKKEKRDTLAVDEEPEDGVVEFENGVRFSQAEVIDIAKGVDRTIEDTI